MAYFNKIHHEAAPYGQQMDVLAEQVKRDAVLEPDVTQLSEIDTAQVDLFSPYNQGE